MTMKQFKDVTQAMEELTRKEPDLPEDVAWDIFLTMIASVTGPNQYLTFVPQQEN